LLILRIPSKFTL
jgi:hypothetical protein